MNVTENRKENENKSLEDLFNGQVAHPEQSVITDPNDPFTDDDVSEVDAEPTDDNQLETNNSEEPNGSEGSDGAGDSDGDDKPDDSQEPKEPEYAPFEFLHGSEESSGVKLYFVQVPSQQAQLCFVVDGLEEHPFIYDNPKKMSCFRDDAFAYGAVIDEGELKAMKKLIQNDQTELNKFKISVYNSPLTIHKKVYGTYNEAMKLLEDTSPYIAESKDAFTVGEIKPGKVRPACFKWKTKISKSEAIAFTKVGFLAFMNGYTLQEISEMDPEEPISGEYTYADADDAVRQLKKDGRIHTNNSGTRLDVTLKVSEGYFDSQEKYCTRLADEKFVILLKK